jgi:hypothetical protein
MDQKRRALRAYKTTLAIKLRARYGCETHYTPDHHHDGVFDGCDSGGDGGGD